MTRWGRRVIGLAAAACFVLAAAAWSGGAGESATTTTGPATRPSTTALALSEEQTFELQARAIARAWPGARLCMNTDDTPAELRALLAPAYDEIVYTGMDPQFHPAVGWDACTLVGAAAPRWYRADVVGVDVWILRGFLNGIGETYLFLWDGTTWVDATPEDTGVTVTSSVS
jgi:hypothetical protein